MRRFTIRHFAAAMLSGSMLASASVALAQDQEGEEKAEWDVQAPQGAIIREVPIQTDEGTWMDVDVSPDGDTIAFALLGDIYTVPMTGGAATRIAQGLAWEVHPRFSPDGSRIAFTSDRGGGDNIWVMNADGSDKRQVTKEEFRLLDQPTWSPDGRFIAAKKHFTTQRSLGTGEIWMYHVSGGGGVQVVERRNEELQKELGEPVFAPDGSAIYYTRNTTGGNTFIYAQDSNAGVFAIEKHDLDKGEVTTVVDGYGGAVRPAPSPDGTEIAFVRRDKDTSQLWVKELATGRERMIYDALDLDVQETWAVTGVYPNMDWTPDSASIVFWAGGKLNRVDRDGENHAVIPFSVSDTRGIADAPHPEVEVAPDRFTTRMAKFGTLSPDGSRVVFETLGKLHTKSARGRDGARPMTGDTSDAVEAYPAFSRDGSKLAFVRWTDDGLGEIVVANANGANAKVVSPMPGHYANLAWSPDGRTIAYEKRTGGYLTAPEQSENPGIYLQSASGGDPVFVTREGSTPQFGASNDRIFMVGRAGDKLALMSSDLEGDKTRTHATGSLVNDFRISPDGATIAFRQNYEVFAMPVIPGGKPVDVNETQGPVPITMVSKGGADFMGWARGGETLFWSIGPDLKQAQVSDFFASKPKGEGEEENGYETPGSAISMAVTVNKAAPSGTVAITGAKILTMAAGLDADDAGVIENGVVVIKGDRIAAIGAAGEISVPADATVVDASGKVVMPGFVDAHHHGPHGTGELIPQQNWSLIQDLAMGTTTTHNPSSDASLIFASAERQMAGRLLAPRIFSTGEIVYGAKAPSVYARIDTYEEALAHVRRIKAQGGISIKNYNQPRREQRQMVARASAEENMLVVAEGGSLFGMDMNLIADGNSTMEHNVPGDVFYEDVLQFFGQSNTNYTPTLVVTYGGLAGDPYWRQAMDVFDHPLMIHSPPKVLLANNARRTKAPDWAFVDDNAAREAKKLSDRGIKVSIGAHGQQPGLGAHWEIWSFARGGYSAVEALKTATIYPAQSLGMAKDVGSLEVGKLADLLVLTADPTANVRDSDTIESVMIGGRMYDAKTMQEVATGDGGRRAYWWETGMGGNAGGSERATHAGGGHNHGDGDGDGHSY